jgi:hypothetical protein
VMIECSELVAGHSFITIKKMYIAGKTTLNELIPACDDKEARIWMFALAKGGDGRPSYALSLGVTWVDKLWTPIERMTWGSYDNVLEIVTLNNVRYDDMAEISWDDFPRPLRHFFNPRAV